MCPFLNLSEKKCKVTPFDSAAPREESEIKHKCTDSYNYKNCGNYEAYQRGDYKVER